MYMNSVDTLSGLPTEVIIQIFAHLQVADLFSVQRTCRRFYDVITNSSFLQYILHTKINLLEDLLPPDVSLYDRIALLKRHEAAWKNIDLNMFTQFVTSGETPPHCYILQGGYLIYKAVFLAADTARYGYMDLYSISDRLNTEARWKHISLAAIRPLSDIVFAVDHNLAVAIRF